MRYDHQKAMLHFGARYCAECNGDRWLESWRGSAIDCPVCWGSGLYTEEMRFQFTAIRRYTISRRNAA